MGGKVTRGRAVQAAVCHCRQFEYEALIRSDPVLSRSRWAACMVCAEHGISDTDLAAVFIRMRSAQQVRRNAHQHCVAAFESAWDQRHDQLLKRDEWQRSMNAVDLTQRGETVRDLQLRPCGYISVDVTAVSRTDADGKMPQKQTWFGLAEVAEATRKPDDIASNRLLNYKHLRAWWKRCQLFRVVITNRKSSRPIACESLSSMIHLNFTFMFEFNAMHNSSL